MKLSYNKIRFADEHYDIPNLAPHGLDDLVEKIGAQLGAVEEVVPLGDRFDGVLIVKVVSCEKHPDADKLQVCRIDDGGVSKADRGDDGLVQVVCGAPNVRAGMHAAWLPPGATVPSTRDKEPFVLEARELRGVISNGMLASPKELGVGDSHEGLLEVDVDAKPGTTFTEAYRAEGEAIIDIENKMFTHRPDCFGLLGVEREIAGIQGLPFKSPDWYVTDPKFPAVEGEELKLKVTNELPKLVPRFTAITLSDVKVGPSPVWLQIVLNELGVRPINNIVDLTNFWMLETGQPLHAYDYDKVKALSAGDAAHIVIRQPKKGEKIKLLNGKELEPRPEAIMIASDKQLIGVGGVMGGSDTEVDEHTRNIIIECANFDMYSIRRTSMAHGLFTDAVTRFTKGQSPLQNPAVVARIVEDIREHAGGKVASAFIDTNHVDKASLQRGSVHAPVTVSADFVNTRLGLELSAADIRKLLENVEFDVKSESDELTVTAPFWRTDVEIAEDVVEEVGRLYGYDQLPLALPARDLTPATRDPLLDLKADIRGKLAKAGANEVLTYSFVPGDLLDKTGQDRGKAFEVANALSPDLQYYRISLIPSLLDKVHPNIKAGYDEFALFELGKGHSLDDMQKDGLPSEFEFTALVATANDKLKKPGAAYYQAKAYLEALAGVELVFKPVAKDMQQYPVVKPYDLNRSALVSIKGGDFLGIIGEFRPSVTRAFKLPKFTAGFEIDTAVLLSRRPAKKYEPLSRFPSISQDITLKVPVTITHQRLIDFFWSEYQDVAVAHASSTLSSLDIYAPEPDSASKSVTLHFTITSHERTLTDAEVNKALEHIAAAAETKFKV